MGKSVKCALIRPVGTKVPIQNRPAQGTVSGRCRAGWAAWTGMKKHPCAAQFQGRHHDTMCGMFPSIRAKPCSRCFTAPPCMNRPVSARYQALMADAQAIPCGFSGNGPVTVLLTCRRPVRRRSCSKAPGFGLDPPNCPLDGEWPLVRHPGRSALPPPSALG